MVVIAVILFKLLFTNADKRLQMSNVNVIP